MTDLLERTAPAAVDAGADNGGVPARRAMVRWAWRLFRREWRQQALVLALIIVAVAATFVGAAVATNTPPPANAGFGTAQDAATFQVAGPQLKADIAKLEHLVGPVDVIENQTVAIPGSIDTYDLRAQNPHGPYGQPMLSLVSGHYPTAPDEVAVTDGVASAFNLKVGDVWHQGGTARRVVGIVQNPQSLLDEFALVEPGQVTAPTSTTVLFDAHGVKTSSIGANVQTAATASPSNAFNPETIVLALATIGMMLVGLVSVGGFTVLAQRRLRSIGMLGSLGATDRHIRLVMRANGLVVGVVGAVVGAALGLAAWLAYRPHAEASAHHLIGAFALPWAVIGVTMALAIVATFFAASRPAHAVTKMSIVTALSGRPDPPKQVHRSVVPGVIAGVVAFVLLGIAGGGAGSGRGGPLPLVLGLVALIVAVILLSPLCLAVLARSARRAPVAVRLAVRDLARYRSRSGSALAAISLGVLIAVIICVVAAARYGNALDYAGPNLASNQLIVYTPNGNPNSGGPNNGGPNGSLAGGAASRSGTTASPQAEADAIASGLGAHGMIELEDAGATLQHAGPGRQFSGTVYVATPQLLRAFGISASSVAPAADILTMRPGLASLSGMQLVYGNSGGGQVGPGGPGGGPGGAIANPPMQTVGALPAGTSAPNTVITEHAVHELGLQTSVAGWLIQTPHPLTAAQITNARQLAATAGMTIETKNDQPTSAEIINWATVFGILLALGILTMSVGLIRSETAADLRILTATGASSGTRRSITAATAGGLGLLGAVLGTVAGYVATIAFLRTNSLDGLSSLGNIPARNLLLILVAMPLIAAVGGWLLAGREPPAIAQRPLE